MGGHAPSRRKAPRSACLPKHRSERDAPRRAKTCIAKLPEAKHSKEENAPHFHPTSAHQHHLRKAETSRLTAYGAQ